MKDILENRIALFSGKMFKKFKDEDLSKVIATFIWAVFPVYHFERILRTAFLLMGDFSEDEIAEMIRHFWTAVRMHKNV